MENNSVDSSEITAIEAILLGEGHSFNTEHLAFIQRWDKLAVQACPGSGKTTSLLAKLLILDKRLPFDDNSGVLVLSHTNAAVNEIKERIGLHSTNLFSYPNFIGTVQEFTDRFLALPFARSAMKWQITSIDDSLYRDNLLNKYRAVRWSESYGKIGSWLRASNMAKAQGMTETEQEAKQFADKLGEEKVLSYYHDLTDGYIKQHPLSNTVLKDPTKDTHKGLKKIFDEVHKQGVIPFHYAYILALKYIDEHPIVLELLQKRFKYIFIDEMQDMDSVQYRLIEKLFNNSSSVVQCIGDNNQAIYSQAESSNVWQPDDDHLKINGTMRLSQPIATAVQVLGIQPQSIESLVQRSIIKPKILVFDDSTLSDVIPKYGELVFDNGVHTISKSSGKPIRIVGWRTESGERPEDLSLSKYSPTYKKKNRSNKLYRRLEDFVNAIPSDNRNGKVSAKLLIASIIDLLKASEIKDDQGKPYTSKTLFIMLAELNHDLLDDIMRDINLCTRSIAQGEKTSALMEWGRFITVEFCPQFEIEVDDPLSAKVKVLDFIKRTTPEAEPEVHTTDTSGFKENAYNHVVDGEVIFSADLCTVHSVKGETHTATLYLESFCYGKHDSDRIIDILIGNRSQASKAQTMMNMKMAYVGMTRPTDLLCFAVHKDRLTDPQLEALATNWDIVTLVAN